MSANPTVHIALLGGSLRAGSRCNQVVQWCAGRCAARGAVPTAFTGADLEFPFYRLGAEPTEAVRAFLSTMASTDGVVLVSPAYHGTISGLLKNALDYLNDLRDPRRPYLDGRPVGCVVVSLGEQGAGSTLTTLRTVAHALRAWPTPLGVALTDGAPGADTAGEPFTEDTRQRLATMLDEVFTLAIANARRRARSLVAARAEAPP